MVARVIVSLRGVQLHIASIRCTPCFCNHSCNACSVVNSQYCESSLTTRSQIIAREVWPLPGKLS